MPTRRLLVVCSIVLAGAALLVALRAGRRDDGGAIGLRIDGRSYPMEIRTDRGRLVLERPSSRILPAFATAVDLLVELVPPERVVALPETAREWSVLAARASDGWSALPVLGAFSAEEILALAPDLVLVQSWLGANTIETLERKGVPVLDLPLPEDWEGILETIRTLGAILDANDRAETLIGDLESRRKKLASREHPPRSALCYSNWGAGGTTAGRGSTGDLILALAGLHNAAADAGLRGNPAIDKETILELSPDIFVVATISAGTGSPSSDYLEQDPELAALPAIREGRVVTLPQHLFSTASHLVLDAAEALADAADRLPPPDDERPAR